MSGSAWKGLDDEGSALGPGSRRAPPGRRPPLVLSHVSRGCWSSTRRCGASPLVDVHITRLDGRIGRQEAGIRQHRGRDRDLATSSERNGVAVMSPTRLGLEITTMADVERSLVVVNHLLHVGLTTPAQLAGRYRTMTHWPRTPHDGPRASPGRTRGSSRWARRRSIYLCLRTEPARCPMPQFEIKDASGRVALAGGLRLAGARGVPGVRRQDQVREARQGRVSVPATSCSGRRSVRTQICRLTGWRCIRITWADLDAPRADGNPDPADPVPVAVRA